MARIINETPGLICVALPPEEQSQIDPMEAMLDGLDLSQGLSMEQMFKLLALNQIGDRLTRAQTIAAQRDAQRRADQTIDLYPRHQGEGKPARVNEVDDAVWARISKMPVIIQKLDERVLRVA